MPPHDRFKGVLFIVCVLGVASLLPWNVLITQAEFLSVRAHQEPCNQWLADQIVSLTANAYLIMNVGAFLLLLPLGKYISIQAQVLIPFLVSAIIVVLQAWVAYSTQLSGNLVIFTTLLSSGLLGFVTAAMTSATYAVATYLPSIYIQALLLGQSLAGVATSILSFLTIWGSTDTESKPTSEDVKPAAIQYFLACAFIEVLGIAGFLLLPYIPFVQYCTNSQGNAYKSEIGLEETKEERLNEQIPRTPKELSDKVRLLFQRPSASVSTRHEGDDLSIMNLINRLRGAHVLVGLAFFVSLAAFPAIVSLLCSVQNGAKYSPCFAHPSAGRFYGSLFQPLIFLLFNLGDAVGRALPGFHRDIYSPGPLFSYAGLRILLVIGIMLCNIVPHHSWAFSHILWSDWWSTILVLALGVTNGHLATIAFMHAPRFVSQQYRDRVGTIMSFCLTIGLGLGSFTSMLLLWWLQS